jgi:hypothetical protein
MADQNKSNKRPTNTSVDAIDESSFLTELERIGARAGRKTASRSELEQRIKSEGKLLNKLVEEGERTPFIKEGPFYGEQVSGLRESIRGIRSRMNSMESSAITRAEGEASTYISRQFSQSAISVQSSSMIKQPSVQNRAFSMSGQTYEELEARREEVLANIRQTERGAINEVKGMFGKGGQVRPESSAALGAMMYGTQERVRELATINAAQQLQRISGTDPTSRMRGIAEKGQEANKILSAESIANEVRQGSVSINQGGQSQQIKNQDISQEIVNQARTLAQALKELSDGANKTDEELSKLRETAQESAENMEKLQEAQSAGGGRGIPGSQIALAAAGGFNAVGGAAQQILVNQRLGQVQNVAGFANLANEQYDMYRKARGGDVLSQMTLAQLGGNEDFAKEMELGTQISQGLYAAGSTIQAGAGIAQAVEGAGQKINPLSYGAGTSTQNTALAIQGAQNFVQGTAQTATIASDMLARVSSGQAILAGTQTRTQALQALNYVGATQMQGLRDYYTQLDVAAQGAGGRGRGFLDQAMSAENMSAMSAARLSPEQFAQMSQMGFEQMGSTFDTKQIYASRNLERAGFGSMQQNMQRMATLASAGANNPQEGMESVLAAAMTKGLDSSKALNMMVENTAAMVQTSAGAAVGIDTTAATSSMLAAGVNKDMANKEFALQQAMTAAQITRDITTDTSVSYTGMLATAGLQSSLAKGGINIGMDEAIVAQEAGDIATLKSIQNDPKKAAAFFQNQGVNIDEKDATNAAGIMLKEKRKQLLIKGGLPEGIGDYGALAEKAASGQVEENSEEFRQLGRIARRQGRGGGASELIRELQGIAEPNVSPGKGQDLTGGKGADDLKSQLDALRTGGFKQAADAAKFASEELNKFGGALKNLTALQEMVEKDGLKSEETYSKAASKMAEDFSTVAVNFGDKAANTFVKIIERDLPKVLKGETDKRKLEAQVKDASDALNKSKGASAR